MLWAGEEMEREIRAKDVVDDLSGRTGRARKVRESFQERKAMTRGRIPSSPHFPRPPSPPRPVPQHLLVLMTHSTQSTLPSTSQPTTTPNPETRAKRSTDPESIVPKPSSPHTYTSLAQVRKANKDKSGPTPERDRKNGWHLWSVEEAERSQPSGGDVERGGSSTNGRAKGDKKQKQRLSQWNMVSRCPLPTIRSRRIISRARHHNC